MQPQTQMNAYVDFDSEFFPAWEVMDDDQILTTPDE